jgi:hypothetical protein
MTSLRQISFLKSVETILSHSDLQAVMTLCTRVQNNTITEEAFLQEIDLVLKQYAQEFHVKITQDLNCLINTPTKKQQANYLHKNPHLFNYLRYIKLTTQSG